MKLLKTRTILGIACIILSLIVCFGLAPILSQSANEKTEIVRAKENITKGTLITETMLETVSVGAYNLPDSVISAKEEIIGQYARNALYAGDSFTSAKLSALPLSDSIYLDGLNGQKMAVSVTIPSFAAGLSGKLQAGDIITLIATSSDEEKNTFVPEELRYVQLLAVTAASGADKDETKLNEATQEDPEVELPATLTLLVNAQQARAAAELETGSVIHAAFVYRGNTETANKFLKAQEDYFKKQKKQAGSDTIDE